MRPPAQTQVQGAPLNNGPLLGPEPETESEEEHGRDDLAVLHSVSRDPAPANDRIPPVAPAQSPTGARGFKPITHYHLQKSRKKPGSC